MTEKAHRHWQCRDCAHHRYRTCQNEESDHYGHMLSNSHPACEVSNLIAGVRESVKKTPT